MHAMHRVVGKRKFPTGENLDLLLVADGLARRGDHPANTIDLIAEELDAHRLPRLRRKDIYAVAVNTEKPWHIGRVGRGVPHAHKRARHIFERSLLAHGKRGRGPVPAFGRRDAAQKSACGSNHDARLAPRDATERSASSRHDRVIGLLVLPGIIGALRKPRHVFEPHVGSERPGGAVGGLLTGNDIDHRPWPTSELCSEHEYSAGLRDGERGVLSRIERGLNHLRRLGGIELCGNAMDEHRHLPRRSGGPDRLSS